MVGSQRSTAIHIAPAETFLWFCANDIVDLGIDPFETGGFLSKCAPARGWVSAGTLYN